MRYVEMDALRHGPNWTTAAIELRERVLDAIDGAPGWVVDGNLSKPDNLLTDRADLIVWLDLPLRVRKRGRVGYKPMLSSKQIASFPRRPARTSLLVLGSVFVAACSSAESGPSNVAGGAGAAPSAGAGSSVGGAGTSGAGVAGSAGGSGASNSGQGGSPAGGASGSSGGSAAGEGGNGGIAAGGGRTASGASGVGGGSENAPFALVSTAFKEGEQIPLKNKCANVNPKGENISPPLSWGPGPVGTKSYALVLMHVPSPEHWVLWDIPANVTSLPENIEHVAHPAVPAGSKQSLANLDGFTGSGYLGPCPQAPNSTQSYTFTLYALDVETVPGLSATSTPTAAATAVKAHLVAGSQGVSLTGTQIQTP